MPLSGRVIAGMLLSGAGLLGESSTPAGWLLSGTNTKEYRTDRDTSVRHGGQASAVLWTDSRKLKGFATLMQAFRCGEYRGKRVRLRAWVKAQEASSAQLWMRVDTFFGTGAFDNMQSRPIKGTRDWTEAEIVLDVANDAVGISFGLVLDGPGKAWLDDVTIDVVKQDVPVTRSGSASVPPPGPQRVAHERMIAAYAEKPIAPVNLDFEATELPPAANP